MFTFHPQKLRFTLSSPVIVSSRFSSLPVHVSPPKQTNFRVIHVRSRSFTTVRSRSFTTHTSTLSIGSHILSGRHRGIASLVFLHRGTASQRISAARMRIARIFASHRIAISGFTPHRRSHRIAARIARYGPLRSHLTPPSIQSDRGERKEGFLGKTRDIWSANHLIDGPHCLSHFVSE